MSQRIEKRKAEYFEKTMKSGLISQVCPPGTAVSEKDFELIKLLGRGSFGEVFLVRKLGGIDNGKLYAMKQLKKSNMVGKPERIKHSNTELQVLEAVRKYPFLATLHYAFQTDSTVNLVLDFINGGDMYTHYSRKKQFTEAELRFYLGEIILALETLHDLDIIYRDLKLDNVMLDSDGHTVLTDFGSCKQFQVSDVILRTHSFCGTFNYMAPEVTMKGESGYDFSVDWWSLGVMAFVMLTGRYPFRVPGEANTYFEISQRILSGQLNYPDNISPEMKSLLQELLTKDPALRLGSQGAQDIKHHPFFKSLNWEDLGHKKITVPLVPKIDHELDLSNFSEEFTKMTVNEPYAIVAPNPEEGDFRNYSYVAPSLILTDNLKEVKISAKAKRRMNKKNSTPVSSERPVCTNSSVPDILPPVIVGGLKSNSNYYWPMVSPGGLPLTMEQNANGQSSNIPSSPVIRELKRKGAPLEKYDKKLIRKV